MHHVCGLGQYGEQEILSPRHHPNDASGTSSHIAPPALHPRPHRVSTDTNPATHTTRALRHRMTELRKASLLPLHATEISIHSITTMPLPTPETMSVLGSRGSRLIHRGVTAPRLYLQWHHDWSPSPLDPRDRARSPRPWRQHFGRCSRRCTPS